MKIPGTDHPISLAAEPQRYRARRSDHVIADSTNVLRLQEADYPVVRYFPREDVQFTFLSKTEKTTNCPYKGDASYYSLFIDGELLENVVWSYEDPYPAMEAIRGRLAFYSDRIDLYAVTEAPLADRHVPDQP